MIIFFAIILSVFGTSIQVLLSSGNLVYKHHLSPDDPIPLISEIIPYIPFPGLCMTLVDSRGNLLSLTEQCPYTITAIMSTEGLKNAFGTERDFPNTALLAIVATQKFKGVSQFHETMLIPCVSCTKIALMLTIKICMV